MARRRRCIMSVNQQTMEAASLLAETILDQMADAVIYADVSGIIQRWNRAAVALFGHSAAEALGKNLDLIVPDHLRTSHWLGFETAMNSGVLKLEGRPTVTRAQHKTGRKLYIEMSFGLVKEGTSVRGAVAVARDVTQRVEKQHAEAHHDTAEWV